MDLCVFVAVEDEEGREFTKRWRELFVGLLFFFFFSLCFGRGMEVERERMKMEEERRGEQRME